VQKNDEIREQKLIKALTTQKKKKPNPNNPTVPQGFICLVSVSV